MKYICTENKLDIIVEEVGGYDKVTALYDQVNNKTIFLPEPLVFCIVLWEAIQECDKRNQNKAKNEDRVEREKGRNK